MNMDDMDQDSILSVISNMIGAVRFREEIETSRKILAQVSH